MPVRLSASLPPAVSTRLPADRVCDFEPILIRFTNAEAMAEADRCLDCPRQPCVDACPLHNDIPQAMRLISQGNFIEAANVYRRASALPEICARLCPKHRLCEGACVLGQHGQPIALAALEQFVTDIPPVDPASLPVPTGKRVAIIGTGPAGLSAAHWLLGDGHAVTLYEARDHPGGWLAYAIPTYKLPRAILHDKIAHLKGRGAHVVLNTRVGQDIALQDLCNQYDGVFISTGMMQPAQVRLPHDNLPGVYTATEFLTVTYAPEISAWPAIGEAVVVVGGGDRAMDCARTALRLQIQHDLPPNVTVVYRRGESEMPAAPQEREDAQAEGVKLVYFKTPVAFCAGPEGRLGAVVVRQTIPGSPDKSGRPSPIPVKGSDHTLPATTAILALGCQPAAGHETTLITCGWELTVIDHRTGQTNMPGVFAGGDIVRGPGLVSEAVHDGFAAAQALHDYLLGP